MRTLLHFLISIYCSLETSSFCQQKDTTQITRPYFFASANFEINVIGKIMPSSGLQLGLGINLARFFTKKIVLGLYGEMSFAAPLSSNNQYHNLTSNINENVIYNQSNYVDSVKATLLTNAFNKDQFSGCYRSTYGLAFSPFPDKYGEIILFVSKGKSIYPFYGQYDQPNAPNEGGYAQNIEIPTTFKATLMFKPLTLTKMKEKNFLKDHLQIGFYFQKTSIKDASLTYSPLSTYLKPEFFTSNRKSEIQFGIRLGIGIGFLKQIRI